MTDNVASVDIVAVGGVSAELGSRATKHRQTDDRHFIVGRQ